MVSTVEKFWVLPNFQQARVIVVRAPGGIDAVSLTHPGAHLLEQTALRSPPRMLAMISRAA